ncbi:Glycoside hydrolase family 38, N-terminal domain [Dillenia turbinata]|uniref:Glycoside hydrolase family 38, N-terminal domain n=1 Tax=Dillenia turbinata TaxID=194707 RepID=A0AAN8ZUX4_9MAGN
MPFRFLVKLVDELMKYAFFHRGWTTRTVHTQNALKSLANAGRLEFVYDDKFLSGWQIDPFGHSAVQGYLLGAELGFNSIHFARIEDQDRAKHKDDKTLKVIWQGSKTFGSFAQVKLDAYVGRSLTLIKLQVNVTRMNHILWTMGEDFVYQYSLGPSKWTREIYVHDARNRGGDHECLYHKIDFQGNEKDMYCRIVTTEYDPNRNSLIRDYREDWSLEVIHYYPMKTNEFSMLMGHNFLTFETKLENAA